MAEPSDTSMQVDENDRTPKGVDITPEKDGGVLKEIKREGTGDEGASAGDTVFVHYVGTLLDGEKFDSSRDRGEKFSFTLGKGQVIKGWDVGVATMKRGELCNLVCSSEYAYGENGSPPKIPPNATLVFEVELFDWKGEDVSEGKDEGVLRSIIKKGEGYSSPKDGAEVKVHLVGKHEGRVFDDRDDLTFVLGEGSEVQVVPGVEMALKKSQSGEKSKLKVKSQYGFGAEGNAKKDIPAGADLDYEVTLKSFEKTKEAWEMDLPEKLEQAEIFKTKGTNFFKDGKYQLAVRNYKKVVDFLNDEDQEDEENKSKLDSLLLAAQLNLAMCHLKLNQNLEAREACEAAIKLKPNSDKAHFRQGQAEMNIQNNENAIKCFKRVLEIDPNNKAAKNQITVATQKIKAEKAQQKKLYAGMFQKFAEKDAKLEESKPVKDAGSGDSAEGEAMQAEAANGEPETVST